MIATLVGWWIYELTSDPFAIGLVGLSEFLPAFLLALYSGHVIDNADKKKLLLKTMSGYVIAAGLLLFLSTFVVTHNVHKLYVSISIYAVIFCTGILRSFTGPNFTSLIANIVPRQFLQNATTWSQGSYLAASVTGHATGGFLIAFLGNTGTLTIICVLLTTSLITITQLKPKPAIAKKREIGAWQSMMQGLRFVYKTKVLLAAFTLDMFAVLFGGAVAMVPVFARDILKVGPMGFGWLNAAADIGAVCSVIMLTISPFKRGQGKKLFIAIGGFGVCIILFGLSKWFLLSFAALVVAGMLDGISVVIRGTVMQLKTPDQLRGRVSSVSSMFINSSNELGQFESGVTSRLMGVAPSVIFGGAMTILITIITWFRFPSLKKFEY